MIDIDSGGQVFGGGRTCPCGGQISRGVLVGNRERWSCRACGRYEVMYGLPSESEPEGDGSPCLVGNGHDVQDVV
jgi:hypothetical protein